MHDQQPKTDTNAVDEETRQREQAPELVPRIYVASLSDYNEGRLHGVWVEAACSPEELFEAIEAMLRASPTPGAEEWAIHDYEGFGPLSLSEYESLATVSAVALGIAEHGEAYAHWASLVGTDEPDRLAQFDDAYRGCWESVDDYCEELLEDTGILRQLEEAVPAELQPYVAFDVAAMARDMEMGGDIATSEGSTGVHVFDGGYG